MKMIAFLRSRLHEPSTHNGLGWFLAALSWSDYFSSIVHAALMIGAAGCFLAAVFFPENR